MSASDERVYIKTMRFDVDGHLIAPPPIDWTKIHERHFVEPGRVVIGYFCPLCRDEGWVVDREGPADFREIDA